tara:strand:+ start:24764 stop:24973 length:210 start_codon:yes stop_codon:yes gene_type:complete
MSFTTAQLAAIREAYARGVTEATLPDGSKIRYRSLEEMDRIIRRIEDDLGINARRVNVVYPTHSRGFHG